MGRQKTLFVPVFSFLLFLSPYNYFQDNFSSKLKSLKWIGYAPTNFNPQAGVYPSHNEIRKDLETLKAAGFDGIVTYGSESTLGDIPFIAKQLGFEGMIMGVWDIQSFPEMRAAVQAQGYVDGYCIGNEGYKTRYDFQQLKKAIDYIKLQTGKPATTAEQIDHYYYDTKLVNISDWLFVNVHPFLHDISEPKKAVTWLKKRVYNLQQKLDRKKCNKLVMIKELGFPTEGQEKCSQLKQQKFLSLMEQNHLPFVYFEAFDQPWKQHLPVEPYWGLFDSQRHPKLYIQTKQRPEFISQGLKR